MACTIHIFLDLRRKKTKFKAFFFYLQMFWKYDWSRLTCLIDYYIFMNCEKNKTFLIFRFTFSMAWSFMLWNVSFRVKEIFFSLRMNSKWARWENFLMNKLLGLYLNVEVASLLQHIIVLWLKFFWIELGSFNFWVKWKFRQVI